jgi:polysaccharide pyruvyl transferase WcaK-like protein
MALAAGTPAVAVAYSGHKTQGVMQAVDLPQYTMELDTFNPETALSLLLSALSSRTQIQEKIDRLRQEGNAIFNASLRALTDSGGSNR